MTGELIPTGVTFGVGRNSINNSFSGTAYMNNIELDSGGNFSAGTGGGVIYSGGTDLYNIFLTSAPNNTTASNGLTKTGDNITLGGQISGNTSISLSGLSTFILSGSDINFEQIKLETNYNPANPASLIVGKAAAQLYSESGVSTNNSYVNVGAADVVIGREIGGVAQQFYISESDGIQLNDNINNRGIEYGGNYHANYTNRSLTDYEYVNNHVASATTSGGGVEAYTNIGSGSTFTWNVSGDSTNYEVTLTANTSFNLTNVRNGEYGTIIVKQDGNGNWTLTPGTVNGGGGPSTHKVVNGGGGAFILTSTPNAYDILSFTYNGTYMFWSIGNDYT